MGYVDDVLGRMRPQTRAWPVGAGTIGPWETAWGHDDNRFSPEEYENYIATSNDVYSVVSARARLLAGLDLRFYRGSGTKKKEVTDGQAVNLYRHVNHYWTQARLARMDEMSMGIWGETYWALEPPSAESPFGEIWWLKPSRMMPAPHVSDYLEGYLYTPQMGGEVIHFEPDEVVWFRYPNPIDEFSALSPLGAARLAADAASAMMRSNERMFTGGLQLAGLVVPPHEKVVFSEEQADDLEKYLKRKLTGPENAHRWAVLRYEAKFNQMTISPKDAEFVSGLNLSFRQVCRAYGMQASLHNDLEQSSPGDTAALERVEWARTLAPDARFRAEEIKEAYLRGGDPYHVGKGKRGHVAPRFGGSGEPDHCEYDFSAVPALQESATEVWARDTQALDRGMITINEWRERNGLPPVEWGAEPWLPLNKAQFKDGQLQIPGGAPGAPGGAMGLGLPQDAIQGGPQFTDPSGVPLPKPPDDERNPVNKPQRDFSHMEARRLLSALDARQANGKAVTR